MVRESPLTCGLAIHTCAVVGVAVGSEELVGFLRRGHPHSYTLSERLYGLSICAGGCSCDYRGSPLIRIGSSLRVPFVFVFDFFFFFMIGFLCVVLTVLELAL